MVYILVFELVDFQLLAPKLVTEVVCFFGGPKEADPTAHWKYARYQILEGTLATCVGGCLHSSITTTSHTMPTPTHLKSTANIVSRTFQIHTKPSRGFPQAHFKLTSETSSSSNDVDLKPTISPIQAHRIPTSSPPRQIPKLSCRTS